VNRQSVTEEEAAQWFDELAKLEQNGRISSALPPF
jgi:hypothetical protein